MEDRLVIVALEHVLIRFDGYSAAVKISPIFKNSQCGICGHYDGERYDEFRKSDNKHAANLEDYHRSYFYRDRECEIDEEQIKDKRNYEYIQKHIATEILKMVTIEKRIVAETIVREQAAETGARLQLST
ncbi:unnamed protein product [Gongylonema pulchrum]|uniref:VWFD domain-containing protein n=1 Tax=Gongylonema pulchrum TaxID=637853 RepID=A0A183ERZ1_9BILA|nr:unnamed protein product [Gongylonema pulchrum]